LCEEFSQCYDNVSICLWTNGSLLNQSAAQAACEQQNAFLPRITNRNDESKLRNFGFAARDSLGLYYNYIWIDVKAVAINDFHWIDGSPLAG